MSLIRVSPLHRAGMARLALAAGAAAVILASPASAKWPDVVSVAPEGAHMLIGTARLADVDRRWDDFLGAIDMRAMAAMMSPVDALGMLGVTPIGLNQQGSAGLAFMPGDYDGDEPPMLALLPVSNYAEWLSSLSIEADPSGVAEVIIGLSPEPVFVRSGGTHAVLGRDKALVEGYRARPEALRHYQKQVGRVGAEVVEGADFFAILDFETVQPVKEQILASLARSMEEQMAGAMAMGAMMGAPAGLDEMQRSFLAFASLLIEEGTGAVAGVRFGDRGMMFDMALQAREDSRIAALLPGVAQSRNLLTNLPDQQYLAAFSMDFNGVRLEPLMQMLQRRAEAAGPDGMPGMDAWKHADGMAMAVLPSPGGMTGGFLSRTVMFLSGDARRLRQSLRDGLEEVSGMEIDGVTFITEYAENARQVAGTGVDRYAVRQRFPADRFDLQQQMAMLWGPSGLRGYVATTPNGLIQTIGLNEPLMQQTLEAQAARTGLGANRTIASVDGLLPRDPAMRGYLNLGTALQQVPMIGMFVPGLDLDEMVNLPPIAAGAAVREGGVVFTLALPSPVLKAAVEMGMQMGAGMGSDWDDDDLDDMPPLF